ncbi:unnamed protein product, partial [Prorocentrum cordatum]
IQAGLGAQGIVVEVASVAADLGIERGSGAKISKPRHSRRIAQAHRRVNRINKLARVAPRK